MPCCKEFYFFVKSAYVELKHMKVLHFLEIRRYKSTNKIRILHSAESIVTSIKEVMYFVECVYLFIWKITQKVMDHFW